MKNIMSFVRWLLIFQVMMSFGALGVSAWAQVDPTKALIGQWEGQIEANLSVAGVRILIINSVKAKGDGEWVARGRFGLSDQVKTGPGGQEMSVSLKDNDVFIEFVTENGRNPLRLKLVGDNKLEGTINIQEKGQKRPADKRIKLEKVEPKAGDVK